MEHHRASPYNNIHRCNGNVAECISKHIENEREKLDLPTEERTLLTNTAYITSNTRTKTDEYIKIIIIINIMRRSVA